MYDFFSCQFYTQKMIYGRILPFLMNFIASLYIKIQIVTTNSFHPSLYTNTPPLLNYQDIYLSLIINFNMEARVHKLLILAGEQGVELEARDFKKLSEVIVNQYLSQPNIAFRNFLVDIIVKVVRGIPLKSHLYAGLTVAIANGYSELAGKILEGVVLSLQNDLSAGKFKQCLNTLNYLSETMNVSFFNSLNYMNLLEDLLQAAEKEAEASVKKSLISLLVRALPLCAYSLHQKTYHQFKKFMQKLFKLAEGDDLCSFLYGQFTRARLGNYSAMNRIGYDFGSIGQHQGKLRIHLQIKSIKQKEGSQQSQLYKWQLPTSDNEYQAYRKGQGLIIRLWVEQLIQTFSTNGSILNLKITNLALWKSQNQNQIKFLIQTLILRGIRSKNGIAESSILVNLRNNQQLSKHSKIVQSHLFDFFNAVQNFDLTFIVSFSKLFAYVFVNSREQIDLSKYSHGEQNFLKRAAFLRLVLQKISLLNDKFKCPGSLSAYQTTKPSIFQQQFVNTQDKEIFEQFDKSLKIKSDASSIMQMINSERNYEIFLQALFRKTCLSQTHLNILEGRYHSILTKFEQWDWTLINKIRNFFRNSFFHRLLYLRLMINRKVLSFASYINYVGSLKNKTDLEMLWIKMQLNELNSEFGKLLKLGK